MKDLESIPEEILQEADEAMNNLLPNKRKEVYEREYNLYKLWKAEKSHFRLGKSVDGLFFRTGKYN